MSRCCSHNPGSMVHWKAVGIPAVAGTKKNMMGIESSHTGAWPNLSIDATICAVASYTVYIYIYYVDKMFLDISSGFLGIPRHLFNRNWPYEGGISIFHLSNPVIKRAWLFEHLPWLAQAAVVNTQVRRKRLKGMKRQSLAHSRLPLRSSEYNLECDWRIVDNLREHKNAYTEENTCRTEAWESPLYSTLESKVHITERSVTKLRAPEHHPESHEMGRGQLCNHMKLHEMNT